MHAVFQRQGAVFADVTPLPELAELHDAVYLGDGQKHLSWEYLKALTRSRSRSVHGRWLFHRPVQRSSGENTGR